MLGKIKKTTIFLTTKIHEKIKPAITQLGLYIIIDITIYLLYIIKRNHRLRIKISYGGVTVHHIFSS